MIALLTCSDPDASANGQVDMTLYVRNGVESNMENFFILENNVIKTGRSLDREMIPMFFIDIQACDRGNNIR